MVSPAHLCYFVCLQVISRYETDGFDFLLQVFNSPNYLEDLTGLSKLYTQTLEEEVCVHTCTYVAGVVDQHSDCAYICTVDKLE